MKKVICGLGVLVAAALLVTAFKSVPKFAGGAGGSLDAKNSSAAPPSPEGFLAEDRTEAGETASETSLPDALLASYYKGHDDPAFEYFQKSKIQKFLAMWVKEGTGDIENPQWDLDSFTEILVLDHDLVESRPEQKLHYCTFSDGSGRYGYVIVEYHGSDPSISNWGVGETTPYLYDLRANMEAVSESLRQTDIDLSTATASRVYLFDRDKRRADQVILFTDGKEDKYVCYFGDTSFEIEKW